MADTDTAPEAPESPVAAPLPAGDTTTAPPAAKGPEIAPQKPADAITGLLDRYLANQRVLTETYGPAIRQASEAVTAAEVRAAETSERALRPAIEGVKAAASVPAPPLPQAIPEPPVPSLRPRPFLASKEGEGAVSAVVTGLGLLATLAMAGRAPVAALNSLTGAMNGWAAGDAVRADREWREYLQTVDRIRHENGQALRLWDAAMQASGANMLQAEARYKAATAEAGLADKWAAVAQGGMGRLLEMLKYEQGVLNGVFDRTASLLNIQASHELRGAIQRQTAEYRQAQLDLRERELQQRVDAARERMDEKRREFDKAFGERQRQFQMKWEGAFNAASDPAAIDFAATMLIERGTMPQLGAGMAQARVGILKRAAEMMTERGMTPQDAIARQQLNRAVQGALTANMRQTAQLGNFIKTAEKIKEQGLAWSEKVDRTGMPIFNRWLQAGQRAVAGDPDISGFDLANASLAAEFARVMNSATGGGVSTVDARRHALELLNTAMTKEQYRAAVGQIHAELMARVQSLREESQELQNLTRGVGTLTNPTGQGATKLDAPKPKPAGETTLRVRRKKDGRTGTLILAPGEQMPAEYEVVK